MNRRFRLVKSADFKRVRRSGKSYAHPLIVLIALQNEEDRTRIGVAAGRTLGNAVNRNRAKRVLRAGIRPFLGNISPGWDILLIARKPLLGLKSLEAEQSLKVLLDRAHLWCEKKEF